MVKLPTVKLNTTLTDLYRQASPKNADKCIGQVLCGASSVLSLTSDFPRSIKYIYQDRTYNSVPDSTLRENTEDLRRSLALTYLSLVPQREAFVAGRTAVFMFNIDQSHAQAAHTRREAEKTLAVLHPAQRPRLVFCPGPASIPLRESGVNLLNYKLAFDSLAVYPLLVDLDTQWLLNTKAALARSGLPTPRCKIVDVDGYGRSAKECCAACRSGDAYNIPTDCDGSRGKWLDIQINRVIEAINAHALPFVVKNQQSYGGAGTYFVETEHARQQLVHKLSGHVLRRLFSQITETNHELRPGTVLISEMVAHPVGDYGLNFFVTDTGEGIFLSVSEQMLSESHAWVGSTVDYRRQEDFQAKFSRLTADIARWLHEKGYFGPAGADVLETKNGEESTYHIVDLNVRTSGSLCLPLLRDHFESRGMHSASSFFIKVKDSREGFIETWQEAFELGQLCILGWCEDRDAQASLADIAIGAENDERLQNMVQRVREATEYAPV